MGIRDEKLLDVVVLDKGGRVRALAASPLASIGAHRHSFYEAFIGDEDNHLLALYEVFDIDLLDLVRDDLGPALISVFLGDGKSLRLYDVADSLLRSREVP